ncbi:hypothetical protein PoB_000797300 [Plakobranchus ocellatus]|uniref:Uncharacterized protein n=1 Tax=Plakobranchus ocellatus TaxID=259542 RepID=A0AAV3YG46_9GAST|nr:hypothetical protein PoB_000797300 [Plakobranchus ocellatus]
MDLALVVLFLGENQATLFPFGEEVGDSIRATAEDFPSLSLIPHFPFCGDVYTSVRFTITACFGGAVVAPKYARLLSQVPPNHLFQSQKAWARNKL